MSERELARSNRSRFAGALAGAGVLAAAGVTVAVLADTDPPSERSAAPTLPELAVPTGRAGSDRLEPGAGVAVEVASPVGTIRWSRIDSVRELPDRIGLDASGRLTGWDDHGPWHPDTSLVRWHRTNRETRIVGGERWTRTSPTALVLEPASAEHEPVDIGEMGELLGGDDIVSITAHEAPGDGFPFEISDRVIVPLVVRRGLPWSDLVGTPYRVEVSHGDDVLRLASADAADVAVQRFSVEPVDATTWRLIDADGVAQRSFEATGDRSPVEALSGRTDTVWVRRLDDGFDVLPTPWSDGADVDMVLVGDGVIVRASATRDDDVTLWFTRDGSSWESIDLPADRATATPVALERDALGAVITVFTEAGLRPWATTDGIDFHSLPVVPGIERRTRGEFGWVTADPRSAPTLRVSPDGLEWDDVDIGPLLGMDRSRWDVSITAAAVGDRIVVLAERSVGRTLLVGEVDRP